jgi:molybdopterin-guanine dinucleotide biosynthesis protein A
MSGDIKDVKIAAAIMAGGKSSRMAGRHKGMLLTPEGVTFTERLSAEMHKLTDLVYISYGDTTPMQAEGCVIVRDIYKGCGPVGGLHAVLTRAAEDGAAAVAAAACDMPYVTADLYRYLYAMLAERTGIIEDESNPFELYDGAVAVTGGKIHPLAGVYSVGAAGICKTQLEERNLRLREALGKLRILYVDLEGTAYERMLLNINTEEDYKEYITGRSRST